VTAPMLTNAPNIRVHSVHFRARLGVVWDLWTISGYSVSIRAREFWIRMDIWREPSRDIVRLVLCFGGRKSFVPARFLVLLGAFYLRWPMISPISVFWNRTHRCLARFASIAPFCCCLWDHVVRHLFPLLRFLAGSYLFFSLSLTYMRYLTRLREFGRHNHLNHLMGWT